MEPSKNTQDGTSPSSWSVNQVCLWLEGQTLGGIVPFVRDQEMCGYALVHLDSEELLKTHVPLGTRIMLKDACKLLKLLEDPSGEKSEQTDPTVVPLQRKREPMHGVESCTEVIEVLTENKDGSLDESKAEISSKIPKRRRRSQPKCVFLGPKRRARGRKRGDGKSTSGEAPSPPVEVTVGHSGLRDAKSRQLFVNDSPSDTVIFLSGVSFSSSDSESFEESLMELRRWVQASNPKKRRTSSDKHEPKKRKGHK